jgi:Mg-chelatase subunit ChlD
MEFLRMSTSSGSRLTLAFVLSFSLAAAALSATPDSRLGTYEKNGQTFFALSLLPQAAADPAQKNDVVVLVDTSASQAGRYRAEAMAALQSLLSSLSASDRVQLMAVDMKATPLCAEFVAPQGAEMQAAIAKLNARTPLGATDLDAGLRTAAASFGDEGGARTVIYIGDGMSKANIPTEGSLRKLVDELRGKQVSVSSFVLGQERNVPLAAALANQTGGIVSSERPEQLAASVHASVLWPTAASLPENVSVAYPADLPPVRTDRDSILIGTLTKAAPVKMEMSGTMNGKPVSWTWTAAPDKASEDFGFLPKLVDLAAADKGLTLPTAGSAALREAAYVTVNSAQQLVKVAGEALAAGNFVGAEKVAVAALSRDPSNPEAMAIRDAAHKGVVSGKSLNGKLAAGSQPELKLTGLSEPVTASGLLAETLAEPPGFLGRVDAERRVIAGKMRAEVENSLSSAKKLMMTNPDQAEQDLKLTLEDVERTPDLEPEVRNQLRRQVENAIRVARQEKVRVDQQVAVAQEQKAAALEQARMTDALAIQQQRIKQLVDRFDSLMDEQRYATADEEIVPEIPKIALGTTINSSLTFAGRFQRSVHESEAIWRLKNDQFVRALFTVEEALVPFNDDFPVVYPKPDQWEELTLRRQKYKAVDLGKVGGTEQRIFNELNKETQVDFVEQPLKDVVMYIAELHKIPIVLSAKKLEEASVSPDTPVTKTLRGVTLRSALRLILKDLELTYVVRDEVLQITTPEDAESQLITKVYPVGDLVIPPINMGGGGMGGGMMGGGMMGGMGGGMGGGMMGGMGGGMGGMGGGMGGMGGGMGGMGGGMFAVEDELNLGAKKASPQAEPAQPAPRAEPRAANTVKPGKRLTVESSKGEPAADAWERYFAGQEDRLTALDDTKRPQALNELLANVRQTIRELMKEKKYGEVSALIEAALRHGQMEPWMYEALALAIRADSMDKISKGMTVDAAQTEALERALLSAVDFAQDEDQLLMIAAYMVQAGLEQRALNLYQQISKTNPGRPEPYLYGLAIAQRLNDVQSIQWGCVGVLSQAWSSEQRPLAERAFRVGRATYEQLLADGKKSEAQAFDAAVRQAQQRDCVIVVTWTGDADIDLTVEEPTGTVVSQRRPRSVSGGVHLGDATSADGKTTAKGFSEAYICPEGFSGDYRIMIKDVWGKPTSGKVTLDIYAHFGSEKQTLVHEQIPIGDKDALATFALKDGRRKESLREDQIAGVIRMQNASDRHLLAQQLAGLPTAQSTSSGSGTSGGVSGFPAGFPFVPGFFLRGAVGYRPVLSTLPTGAFLTVSSAVISADRRYVRVAPSPNFTQVLDFSTFNFVQGTTSGPTSVGGQGGFGGGGAGGGGFTGGGT